MIIQDTTSKVATFGTSESQTFKMQQSRKAFTILSDLYSDKPKAIVRELGCNAADSMVVAGKADQPFHVHVPNAIEPWITIKDYGTGISHKDIYDIYAVYFSSTKTNTNNQIGCLGLGSKSPFCYSDNFTVTSIVDGEKRIYNAYFNEENLPAIALMATEKTSECNGVEIQIPVKQQDIPEFVNAIESSFRFFDVKPTISGGKIKWADEKPTFEGSFWKSYEGFGYGESYAIMGGVTYPIDIYKVNSDNQRFVRAGMVIYFEMGELDFTPSREALSYCPATVKALNDKIDLIKSDFVEKFNETISNKENILDALIAVFAFNQKFAFLDSALRQKAANWNGIDISCPEQYICKVLQNAKVDTVSYRNYGRSKFRCGNHITLDKNYEWYRDDLKRGSLARVKAAVKERHYANDKYGIILFSEQSYQLAIQAGIPESKFSLASTLPKITQKARVVGNKVVGAKIYRMGESYKQSWVAEEYDSENPPAYYIVKPSDGFNVYLNTDYVCCSDKGQIKNICSYYKIDADEVVMVSKTNEHLLVADGVKSFKDFVDSIKTTINKKEIDTHHKWGNQHYSFEELSKKEGFKKLSDSNPFKNFILNVVTVLNNRKSVPSFIKYTFDKTTSEAIKMDSTCPIHHILLNKIGNYSWESSEILTILQELEKKTLTKD